MNFFFFFSIKENESKSIIFATKIDGKNVTFVFYCLLCGEVQKSLFPKFDVLFSSSCQKKLLYGVYVKAWYFNLFNVFYYFILQYSEDLNRVRSILMLFYYLAPCKMTV